MTEEEEEVTHEEYVEEKFEGIDEKLTVVLVLLGIISLELFLVLYAITRMFPNVWRI